MLVEDEPAIRLLFEEELQEDGYEVFTAGDEREAIQRFEEGKLDLIILGVAAIIAPGGKGQMAGCIILEMRINL